MEPAKTAGGSANIGGVLAINSAGFATSNVFDQTEIETLNAAFRAALARHAGLLDRREATGRVRRCHGDLHLRNICVFDREPRLFDCIEFNDQIATVDVLYDLAFLLMDLWHRGFPELANLVMNRYLDDADDEDGFILLPFFVFPLWLGTVPAMLKAFLEQVMRPGTAFAYPAKGEGFAKSLLRGRSARLVVTMGMPAAVYRIWFLSHGIAGMRRGILNFVGISPVRETLLGAVASANEAKRAKWIGQMRVLGERGL